MGVSSRHNFANDSKCSLRVSSRLKRGYANVINDAADALAVNHSFVANLVNNLEYSVSYASSVMCVDTCSADRSAVSRTVASSTVNNNSSGLNNRPACIGPPT
eukprot:Pompholyxophrys_punicea_v1_NODE_614_length_1594_cov_2.565302.p4 type:complete len:103 gc:universal NODE_614_length_1594_cov_2.565302:1181-1489(+)